jgi:nitrogen regulatory protein PII
MPRLQVDPVIDTIIDAAKTEEIGDGKIFGGWPVIFLNQVAYWQGCSYRDLAQS